MRSLTVTGRKLKISESTRRRNPELFSGVGAVVGQERKQNPIAALERHPSAKQSRGPCLAVCIIGFRRRALDDDNFQGSVKHLRDQIARSLECDDGDPRIEWHYSQVRAAGQEGTLVKIDVL